MGMASTSLHASDLGYHVYRSPPLHVSTSASLTTINLTSPSPESPRWLVAQGRIEDAHLVVARVNARGDKTDPRVVIEFQRIVDALHMDKAVAAQAMSPKELIRTPTARRRLAIGASPGLFSCIAGNIIASYYLGQSLTQSGITDRNDQLKAVRPISKHTRWHPADRAECRTQCLVLGVLSMRYPTCCPMGSKINSLDRPVPPHRPAVHYWRSHQEVQRESRGSITGTDLRERRLHLPFPRCLFDRMDSLVSAIQYLGWLSLIQ